MQVPEKNNNQEMRDTCEKTQDSRKKLQDMVNLPGRQSIGDRNSVKSGKSTKNAINKRAESKGGYCKGGCTIF